MIIPNFIADICKFFNFRKTLISFSPQFLKFPFELETKCFCDLRITNNTNQNVAFKVMTTSLAKYSVMPNTGVMHPLDSCVIRVTLLPQKKYPPGKKCKDKFFLQSTIVSPKCNVNHLPQRTFNKDSGRTIEESKLKVKYVFLNSTKGKASTNKSRGSPKSYGCEDCHSPLFTPCKNEDWRYIEEEIDATFQQEQNLQEFHQAKLYMEEERDAIIQAKQHMKQEVNQAKKHKREERQVAKRVKQELAKLHFKFHKNSDSQPKQNIQQEMCKAWTQKRSSKFVYMSMSSSKSY